QRVDVNEYAARLVEGADHVLAQGAVDAGLATHGRINLGEQRGGDLDEVHATLIGSCGKTAHVSDNASTEGKQGAVSGKVALEQGIVDAADSLQGLVFLAIRQHHGTQVVVSQGSLELPQVQGGHGLVGDDAN